MSNNDNNSSCNNNTALSSCSDNSNKNDCSDCARQLSTLANAIALLLSQNKTADDLNVLGNFIVGVGSLLLTMAAQQSACEGKKDKMEQISDLKKQIKKIEESL